MRRGCLTLAAVFAVGLAGARGEEFVAPAPEPVPAPEVPVEPRGPAFQGILSQIFRVFRPLQLINPLAPSYYGTGEENVSKDVGEDGPGERGYTSRGLIVFGIEW